MPKRTRSHELEDESIDRFKAGIPKRWVCREKDRDYGVDLEVEVFDADGLATGLMFYVQLKATDDSNQEQKASIKVDRLRYLASLEAPSIIVRYCASTGRQFWAWNFNAVRQAKPGVETVTVTFETEWTAESCVLIEGTLKKLRRLREASRDEKFPISEVYEVSFTDRLVSQAALAFVVSNLPFLEVAASDCASELRLTVGFKAEELTIALEPIGFLTIAGLQFRQQDLSQVLTFGLAAVLGRMGFHERAATAARLCLDFDAVSQCVPQELRLLACLALKATPIEAVELAVMCEIHKQQDWSYAMLTMELQLSGASRKKTTKALEIFFREAAGSYSDSRKAAALYSLGNVYANNAQYAKSVAAFNAARKAWPEYINAPHLIKEIGGSLFLAQKYRCASSAYRKALELGQDEKTEFCFADSLLFARSYAESAEVMRRLGASEEPTLASEARLKAQLADWLSCLDLDFASREGDALRQMIVSADTSGDLQTRYQATLLLSFMYSSNVDMWSYAIQASLAFCRVEEVLDVMICAASYCGVAPYAAFRERVLSPNEDENYLEEVDNLSIHAADVVKSRKKIPYRTRLLYEDGKYTVFSHE